jgi:hypothetical protein
MKARRALLASLQTQPWKVSILISTHEKNQANINLDAMNMDEHDFVPESRGDDPDANELSELSFDGLVIEFRKENNIPRPSRSKFSRMITYLSEKRLVERVSDRLEAEAATAKGLSVEADERPGKKRKRASAPKSGGSRRQERGLDASDSDNEDAPTHGTNQLPGSCSQGGPPIGADGSTIEAKSNEPEKGSIRGDLDRIMYPSLANEIIKIFKEHGLTRFIPYIDELKRKYKNALNAKSKPKVKRKPYPRTREALGRLLGRTKDGPNVTIKDEEGKHPWSVLPNVEMHSRPLMRAWWFNSECLIHHGIGFFSGGSDILLDTAEKRNLAIGDHAD